MVDKKILRKVEIKEYDTRSIQWGIKKEIKALNVISVQAVMISRHVVLILNIYAADKLKDPRQDSVLPEYRLFISKNEWEYATQDFTKTAQNWTDMTLADIAYKEYANKYSSRYELDGETDLKIVGRYFGFEWDPEWRRYINTFQKEVRRRRRLKKNEPWTREVEKKMAGVPRELPEDFGKWIQRDVLYKSRYIYYRYEKEKKGIGQLGYCTHCRSNVLVDGAVHKKSGVCPVCGSEITFLCESKSGYIRDRIGASVIQRGRYGLVMRCFEVKKTYGSHYRKPTLEVYERSRTFLGLPGSKPERYRYGHCDETNDIRWERGGFYHDEDGVLYAGNLREVLAGTDWKYSGLYEYASARRGIEIRAADYILQYEKEPKMEHIVKMGLTRIADDIVNRSRNCLELNRSGKDIFQVLGLSKADTRFVQDINGGSDVVCAIRSLRKDGIKITYEQFEEAWGLFKDCFLEFHSVLKHGTTGRILKYLRQQVYGKTRDKYKNILKDWIDYISMGTKLGYDFSNDFVLFPNNLKERHDAAAFLMQEREIKKKAAEKKTESRKISRLSRELEKQYAFESKTMMIVVPKNAEDIAREGQQMHHCVGTYIKRVAKGETAVLFIRTKEAPEVSFYTMEVKDGRVVQCRGKYNKAMTEEVRRFVEQFKKKCLDREKKQDKNKKTA